MRILLPNNAPNDPAFAVERCTLYATSRQIPLALMAKHAGVPVTDLLKCQKMFRGYGAIVRKGERFVVQDFHNSSSRHTYPIYQDKWYMDLFDALLERLDPEQVRIDGIIESTNYETGRGIVKIRFEYWPMHAHWKKVERRDRSRWTCVMPKEGSPIDAAADEIAKGIRQGAENHGPCPRAA